MKNVLKKIVFLALFCSIYTLTGQSKNSFIGRTFWETNPTIAQVEQKIKEGNSATTLNRSGFDAVVYALLANADTKVIKHLLSKKGNAVNKLTHDGRTYLFWASYKNNISIVKHLLKHGAKTDIIDDKGYSVLNFTASAGVENTKLYDLLIKHGANVKKDKTPRGANALLLIAPRVSDFKMLAYFISKGIPLNTTDKNGNGVFNYTAQSGNIKMLQLLIKKGVTYKERNKNGGNAMLFATKRANSLGFYKYLESLGIHPNIKNKDGKTPLHNLAYRSKSIEVFKYFINKGVGLDEKDIDGNTALINASSRNSLEVIKLLAINSKNINHKNKDGQSALTKALRNNYDVVKFIIHKDADVSVIDKKGNHLAHYLFNTYTIKKRKEFHLKLELLQSKGLDIAKQQKNGNTLYHLAVGKRNMSMLKFINTYKIDINAKNAEGLTALQKAVMTAKNNTIMKYLISKGANTTVKTDFDESLYDLAKENEALKNVNISFLK